MAKRYHVSRHIDAPVERVWALLTDASRYRDVVSIEGPITEGAEWRPRPDGTGTPTLTRLLMGCATIARDERVQDGTTLRRAPSLTA
jgi:hypothetical protein